MLIDGSDRNGGSVIEINAGFIIDSIFFSIFIRI
jgi:hypothetical protein